jgi:hypothetical protein
MSEGILTHVYREFFLNNRAIYVPSKGTWVTTSDCVWSSKCRLLNKCVLSVEYPPKLEDFFRLMLKVQSATLDDIVSELKLWTEKDDEDHVYLKSLFNALQATSKAWTDKVSVEGTKNKLKGLSGVKCVPLVKVTESGLKRKVGSFSSDMAERWLVVDSYRLKDAFASQVWLLDFPLGDYTRLWTFLELMGKALYWTPSTLTEVVQEKSQYSGIAVECPGWSHFLRARSPYLGRFVVFNDITATIMLTLTESPRQEVLPPQ